MEHINLYGPEGRKVLVTLLAASILAACGGGGGSSPPAAVAGDTTTASPAVTTPGGSLPEGTVVEGATPDQTPVVVYTPPVTPPVTPPGTTPEVLPDETKLQIGGTPKPEAKVDEAYSFVPTSDGPDGDLRYFSVTNLPDWMSFETATGELTGTPTDAETGVYTGVTIEVVAGTSQETLAPFDIEVVANGTLGVTLAWVAPTQNTDGTVLTDLVGYRIRYGETSGSYTTVISLTNPGLASYYIEGLVPSTYYFVISALNSKGVESGYSNESFTAV